MRRSVIALLGVLWCASALAAGVYTPGMPEAGDYPNTLPLTGNERIPADTSLPGGVEPQSEAITVTQLINAFTSTVIAVGGNTAINLAVRFGWQLTPYDLGAKGDGVTDDTVAVQAWLNALIANGSEGFCPAGTYQLTGTVKGFSPTNYYHMRGAGNSCNFYVNFNGWGQPAINLSNPINPTGSNRGHAIEWDHFQISYNAALTAPPVGLRYRYATDFVLHDFYIGQFTTNRGTLLDISGAFNLEHVRDGNVWGGGGRIAQHLVPAGVSFSITASTNTLTSSVPFFNSADTGFTYYCLGTSGGYGELFTVTYVNSTTVTTDRNASNTHTGANCSSGGITGAMTSGSNVVTLSANNVPTSFVGRTVYIEAIGTQIGSAKGFRRGTIATVTPGTPETLTVLDTNGNPLNASYDTTNSVLVFDPAIEIHNESDSGVNDIYLNNIHSEDYAGTGLIIQGCAADCTIMRQKLAADYFSYAAYGTTEFDSDFDAVISNSDVNLVEFIAEQANTAFAQILVEGQTVPIAIGNSTGLLTTGQYHVAMKNNFFNAFVTVGLASSAGKFDAATWCPNLYYNDGTSYYGIMYQGGSGGYGSASCLPGGRVGLTNAEFIGPLPSLAGSCTNFTASGGSAGGTLTATADCASGTVFVPIAVPDGLSCFINDVTTSAATARLSAQSHSGATFTLTGVLNGDVLAYGCIGW